MGEITREERCAWLAKKLLGWTECHAQQNGEALLDTGWEPVTVRVTYWTRPSPHFDRVDTDEFDPAFADHVVEAMRKLGWTASVTMTTTGVSWRWHKEAHDGFGEAFAVDPSQAACRAAFAAIVDWQAWDAAKGSSNRWQEEA